MSAEPIHRANFVDQAYEAIKQFIITGALGPGEQLKIDALSRRLGVSSSPIREALRRLENERWVETIPFRGAFVRQIDETELAELYEFREIIELAALRKLLCRRQVRMQKHDPETRGRGDAAKADLPERILRPIVNEILAAMRAGDALAYLAADARFHKAIVDMAGNRRLSELFVTLIEQGRSFMLGRTPDAMSRQSDEPDQHAELVHLIEQGDRRKACKLLRRHLRVSNGANRTTE